MPFFESFSLWILKIRSTHDNIMFLFFLNVYCPRFNATQIDSKNDTEVPVSIFLYTWLQPHPNKGFEHDSYLKVFGDGGNVVLGKTRIENNFWKKLRPNFEFELHGRVFRIDGCDL